MTAMTSNVIFNPSAPLSLADMDLSGFEPLFETKRTARKEAIQTILEKKPMEPIMAAILYDSEQAPETTNRKQLQEGGITLPPHDTLSPEETTHHLWVIINALAIHNTFFCDTDRLTDEEFYKLLDTKILDEAIRDVPPNPDMSEFISLSACGTNPEPVSDRDELLPRPNRNIPSL